jgi:cell division protein FtsN
MSTRLESKPRLGPLVSRSSGIHRSAAGSTLIGVFVGVALGLAIAAAVAFWILRAGNPYQASSSTNPAREAARDTASVRNSKGDTAKPRFDFYKILPGAEEPKVQPKPAEPPTDRATVDRTRMPDEPAKSPAQADSKAAADRFWLQAGSFVNATEAENLKARLALSGWEANVQEADIPDKGLRYRVRLGPYANTDELNRVKTELGQRGFEVAVIRQ